MRSLSGVLLLTLSLLIGTILPSQEPLSFKLRRTYNEHSTIVSKGFENLTLIKLSYVDSLERLLQAAPVQLNNNVKGNNYGAFYDDSGYIGIGPWIRPDIPVMLSPTKMRVIITHEFGHILEQMEPGIYNRFLANQKYIPDYLVIFIVGGDSTVKHQQVQNELFADAFVNAVNRVIPEAHLTADSTRPYHYYYYPYLIDPRQQALLDSLVLSQRARLK